MFVSQSLKYQLVSVSYIQGDELVVSYRGVSYKKKKCVACNVKNNPTLENYARLLKLISHLTFTKT